MAIPTGGSGRFVITRRSFLKAAVAAGGAAALPLTGAGRMLLGQVSMASDSGAPEPLTEWGGPFFLLRDFKDPATGNVHDLFAISAALCDRIVPADELGPGASAAGAVNYIDVFMAAFDEKLLSSGLVSTSPIWLSGPFSGRWPYGNGAGDKSSNYPTDSFEDKNGQIQFLGLTPAQALVWYLRIYGTSPASYPKWVSKTWVSQVESTAGATGSPPTIPGAQNLRSLYEEGLSAFDDWSNQNFGTGFAVASSPQQDALVALAANPVIGAASLNGLPGLPAPLPNPVPPSAAVALFGTAVLHTLQGTYGLPEYEGRSDKAQNGQVTWASINYLGDTQPLGNSIYDAGLDENEPAEPDNVYSNEGFGFPADGKDKPRGAFTPTGAYREFRPVSYPDPGSSGSQAVSADFSLLVEALEAAGMYVTNFGAAAAPVPSAQPASAPAPAQGAHVAGTPVSGTEPVPASAPSDDVGGAQAPKAKTPTTTAPGTDPGGVKVPDVKGSL